MNLMKNFIVTILIVSSYYKIIKSKLNPLSKQHCFFYYYILLLKYKLKQIEINKKNNIEITFLKNAITKLENVYISDLSKIKIKQL